MAIEGEPEVDNNYITDLLNEAEDECAGLAQKVTALNAELGHITETLRLMKDKLTEQEIEKLTLKGQKILAAIKVINERGKQLDQNIFKMQQENGETSQNPMLRDENQTVDPSARRENISYILKDHKNHQD